MLKIFQKIMTRSQQGIILIEILTDCRVIIVELRSSFLQNILQVKLPIGMRYK